MRFRSIQRDRLCSIACTYETASRNPYEIQVNTKSTVKFAKDTLKLVACFREPPANSFQSSGTIDLQNCNLLYS